DPQQASDSVASVVLSKLKRGSSIDSLFSGVARIELTVPESTSTKISLLLRGKIGTPVQGAKVADGDPAIAYRDIDPKSVFTLRHTELCQKTGLNSAQVTALIAELGLKNRSDCCYVFGPNAAKSPTPGYSAKAIEIIRNEVKKGPEVLKAIVSKHSSRRIHKSK
ncbi:MAG TPA: hypothetical protein VGB55_12745, partial [Tepidisphaeraceae bacterium]